MAERYSIRLESIEVGERHRALSEPACERLAASIESLGLQYPITIRILDEMEIDGEIVSGVPMLVAGAHRLAAAKLLGWSHIDCIEIEDDAITAELWEIAENLHRCELTTEQRRAHLRRYTELVKMRLAAKPVHDGQVSGGGRGNKSVARIVADETGVSLNTVKRATGQIAKPQLVEAKDAIDVVTAQADAIVRAWNRACPEARQLAQEQIDAPIMDQRYG